MKIIFSHNRKTNDLEEQAEFDTPETIQWLTTQLQSLGHEVLALDVGQPLALVLNQIEIFSPDLIFNTAEGIRGQVREGFFPSIFEELEIPFTGSDAYTCNLTMDKDLTRYKVASSGIPVAKGFLCRNSRDIKKIKNLNFPVFIKPNFEGSSKGVGDDSMISDPLVLEVKLKEKLKRFPEGILVEEYIPGKDVTVGYLEGIAVARDRVLVPCDYEFKSVNTPQNIYNYDLKNTASDSVYVNCPANLSQKVLNQLHNYAQTVFELLNIRDLGRIDFRVTPEGKIFFLEINALPSLAEGVGMYLAAAQRGLKSEREVLDVILQSTIKRFALKKTKKTSRLRTSSSKPRIGFTFNQKRLMVSRDPQTDEQAEFDSSDTINAIQQTIQSLGFEVVKIEADGSFIDRICKEKVDIVFNIAEGFRGRYRESQIPAVLELKGIEYTGSDPSSLSLALDKGLAKRIVREAGLNTADFVTLTSSKDKIPSDLNFPLILKPVAEGSSKGIVPGSVVSNYDQLNALLPRLFAKYEQPILIETFLPGREFTVGILEDRRPQALPPMEIVFQNRSELFPIYTYQHKIDACNEVRFEVPAQIDRHLELQIKQLAIKSFQALGCRDVARIDIRLDANGKPAFIECNPLPGLSPGFSDLCVIAEAAGINYQQLIAKILQPALRRYKLKQRQSISLIPAEINIQSFTGDHFESHTS